MKEHITKFILGQLNESPSAGGGQGSLGVTETGLTSSFINSIGGAFSLFNSTKDSGFTGDTVQLPEFQQMTQPQQQQGGGFWGTLAQFGLQALASLRYGTESDIPYYNKGSDTISMAAGLQQAMKRENHPYAYPAVIHKGEKVLSDLVSTTGYGKSDAQLWDDIHWSQVKLVS